MMDPGTDPVRITFFPDFAAKTKREESLTLYDLANRIVNTTAPVKTALPWLKLARFGELRSEGKSLRHNANLQFCSGLEADYDGERVAFGDAVAILTEAGISALVYTSPSHTEDAPRWRVLCQFSEERSPQQRDLYMARLSGVFKGIFAAESWTLSQSYFYGSVDHNPCHRAQLIGGTTIDLLDGLDAGAIGRPEKPAANGHANERPIGTEGGSYAGASDARLEGFRRTVLDTLRRSAVDGQKHAALRTAALTLGGIQAEAGFTDAAAVQWLMDALPATVADWNAAKATAAWGLREGRDKPFMLEDRPGGGGKRKPNGAAPPEPEPEATEADAEPPPDASEIETIRRLSRLTQIDYDRVREAEAKRLNIRVKTLDGLVKAQRGDDDAEDTQQGRPLNLPSPEPWPVPVDGAVLLLELAEFFSRYAFLAPHASTALALWSVHTRVFEAFRHTPRLHIRAIAKNSGKTTVLDLLEMVVCRALPTAHATSSVLFRAIEMAKPTLLLDEADTFLTDNEEVRGILNAGHKRGGQVLRTVGDEHTPRAFRVFAPVAIAGIGNLPGTIADRAIVIPMKRAMRDEMPAPFGREAQAEGIRLARCAVRWALDNIDRMETAEPDMGTLFNRLADNWRPLYAIAGAAGNTWPDLVRAAAVTLTVTDDESETNGVKLLGDIRAVFNEPSETVVFNPLEGAEITSKDLADTLGAMEGRPWAEFGRTGKAITANRLARLLKPFGIVPGFIGPESDRKRGYQLSRFLEVFGRHLSGV